jgi:hypothetical protein
MNETHENQQLSSFMNELGARVNQQTPPAHHPLIIHLSCWIQTILPTACNKVSSSGKWEVGLGFGGGAIMVELVHDLGHETFLLHIVVTRSLLQIAL